MVPKSARAIRAGIEVVIWFLGCLEEKRAKEEEERKDEHSYYLTLPYRISLQAVCVLN